MHITRSKFAKNYDILHRFVTFIETSPEIEIRILYYTVLCICIFTIFDECL
jgi:hypothetical protein